METQRRLSSALLLSFKNGRIIKSIKGTFRGLSPRRKQPVDLLLEAKPVVRRSTKRL